MAKALAENKWARKNRGAEVGLFVFSGKTAPATVTSFGRYGDDVIALGMARTP